MFDKQNAVDQIEQYKTNAMIWDVHSLDSLDVVAFNSWAFEISINTTINNNV